MELKKKEEVAKQINDALGWLREVTMHALFSGIETHPSLRDGLVSSIGGVGDSFGSRGGKLSSFFYFASTFSDIEKSFCYFLLVAACLLITDFRLFVSLRVFGLFVFLLGRDTFFIYLFIYVMSFQKFQIYMSAFFKINQLNS